MRAGRFQNGEGKGYMFLGESFKHGLQLLRTEIVQCADRRAQRPPSQSHLNSLPYWWIFLLAIYNPTFVWLWRSLAINIIPSKNRCDAPCQRFRHEWSNPTMIVIRLAESGHAIHSLQRQQPVPKSRRRASWRRRADVSARWLSTSKHVKRWEAMSGQVESAATCQIQQSSIVGSGQTLQSRRDI